MLVSNTAKAHKPEFLRFSGSFAPSTFSFYHKDIYYALHRCLDWLPQDPKENLLGQEHEGHRFMGTHEGITVDLPGSI